MGQINEIANEKRLRKNLLSWHYRKSKTVAVIDLLDSTYQAWRWKVTKRCDPEDKLKKGLDFRDAIKKANLNELEDLDRINCEMRLGI